jgi:hypothetical protein
MQLAIYPTSTQWSLAIFQQYQPRTFRAYKAPEESEYATKQASTYRVEERIKRWLSYLVKVQAETVQLIGVRTMEVDTQPIKPTRLQPEEAYECFNRISQFLGAPILQCNVRSLRNSGVEQLFRSRKWDRFPQDRHNVIRLGIYFGFDRPADAELPSIVQDHEAVARIRMCDHVSGIHQMLEKSERGMVDESFADSILIAVAKVATDPYIDDKVWPMKDKLRWLRIMLEIAKCGSEHVQGKVTKQLRELKKLERTLAD